MTRECGLEEEEGTVCARKVGGRRCAPSLLAKTSTEPVKFNDEEPAEGAEPPTAAQRRAHKALVARVEKTRN